MSTSSQTPDYYNTVMPYLILKDVAAFLDFTKQVFNATEQMKHVKEDGQIKHAEITIGDSTIMVGEGTDEWKQQPAGLYIRVEDADAAYQKALDAGASTVMELSNQEYGRTSGVKDPSGNTWWITAPLS